MEKDYVIDWISKGKTSTNKDKADVVLIDGEEKIEVTIWGDFPGYANLMPGLKIPGELKLATDPKYKPTLSAPRTPKMVANSGFKQKQIEATMDKKNEAIGRFQATKEESIKMAGAQRDAVLLVTTFYKEKQLTDAEIKTKVVEFRDWFLSEKFNEVIPF